MNAVLMRMLNRRYTRSSIKEARRSAVSALMPKGSASILEK